MAFGATLSNVTCPLGTPNWLLQGIVKTPVTLSVSDASDEHGNIVDSTLYGCGVTSYAATFFVVGESSICGKIGKSNGVESVAVNLNNSDFPQVVVTWREYASGVEKCGMDYSFDIPIPTCKAAANFGAFQLSCGALLNSANMTIACTVTEKADDSGDIAIAAFSGGVATGGAQAVLAGSDNSLTASFTPASGWKVTSEAPVVSSSNTAYTTASITFRKALVPDSDQSAL